MKYLDLKFIINLVCICLLSISFIWLFSIPEKDTFNLSPSLRLESYRLVREGEKHVSLSESLNIQERNGREAEKEVYQEWVEYVGSEDKLEQVILNFKIDESRLDSSPSPIVYDNKRNILRIKGDIQIDGVVYTVTLIIFIIDTGGLIGVNDIAVNIESSKKVHLEIPIDELFIKIPRTIENGKFVSDFLPEKIIQAIERKAGEFFGRLDFLRTLPSEDIFIAEPILSEELTNEDKEFLQNLAHDNPIFRYLITKKKFIMDLVTDTYIYKKFPSAHEQGEYVDSIKAIFRKYDGEGQEFFPLTTFAHELWHHIHLNNLYSRAQEINSIVDKYIEVEMSPEEYLDKLLKDNNFNMPQSKRENFLTEIEKSQTENIFLYMAKNHAKTMLWFIKEYYLDEREQQSARMVLEGEAIAGLFGLFVDKRNFGNKLFEDMILGSILVRIKGLDVEIFADLGLIPDWMRPSKLGFEKEYIDRDYYDLLKHREN